MVTNVLQANAPDDRPRDGVCIPSVSVADVDAAASLVNMDKRGRAAPIRDPQGADLVLLTAREGDPADAKAEIDDWLWDEIWSIDADNTEKFYRSVLGYDEMVLEDNFGIIRMLQ